MATEATLAALAKLTSLREGVLARAARADFADDPAQFKAFSVTLDDLLFDYSKQRIDAGVLSRARRARQGGPGRSPARRDVRRREDQCHREARRPAHRLAQFLRQAGSRRRQGRDARGHRHTGKDAELRGGRARGPGARRARPADDRRHQHRHRRLRSRPRHGHAGARALCAAAIAQPFRLECRRGGHRRHAARARSVADFVHRLVEDFHHARDDDQREDRARLDRARGGRSGGRRPFRRRLDPARQGGRVRHPADARVRLLGLGRRPLFGLVEHRAAAGDRDRARPLQRIPARRLRDRRAFPRSADRAQHPDPDGAAQRLEPQHPRPRDPWGDPL